MCDRVIHLFIYMYLRVSTSKHILCTYLLCPKIAPEASASQWLSFRARAPARVEAAVAGDRHVAVSKNRSPTTRGLD